MTDWPVIITNTCVHTCSTELGHPTPAAARRWLDQQIPHGVITDTLPPPLTGHRSPSGTFLPIPDVLALALAHDRGGRPQWIATKCIAFPQTRARADVDPSTLRGYELLDQVHFTHHAIERFQKRCDGSPSPAYATEQLIDALGDAARPLTQPPAWCRTKPADFYIVAHDEYCLPCSHHGSNGKAFDAHTCMHRASDLKERTGTDLAAHCLPDPDAFPPDSNRRHTLEQAFTRGGELSFHRPTWAPTPDPRTRFWITFTDRLAAPVQWTPDQHPPLRILGLHENPTLTQRILRLLHLSPRT